MKSFYLFLLFTFLFSVHANAQYLEVGNKWIYDHRFNLGLGHYTEKIDSIEIVGDTLFNNLSYYILEISEGDPCGVFLETEYLREENGQIFRLNGAQSGDDLMIDFESTAGYDMNYEAAWQSNLISTNVVQDSTGDETLPNGSTIPVKYQRIINNSSFDDNTVYKLVDKVGYIQYGFLFPNLGTGLCDGEEYQNLRCFISQGDTIHFSEYGCYGSSKTVSTKNVLSREIAISPNPVHEKIFLQGEFDGVAVYDFTGREIEVEVEISSIDVSALRAGFYIIHLRKEDQNILYTSRFIKI